MSTCDITAGTVSNTAGTVSIHLVNTHGSHARLQGGRDGNGIDILWRGIRPTQVKKVIAETDKFYEANKSGCQMEWWVDFGEESLSTVVKEASEK